MAVQVGWVDGSGAITHVADMVMVIQMRWRWNLLRRGIDAGHSPVADERGSCRALKRGASSSGLGAAAQRSTSACTCVLLPGMPGSKSCDARSNEGALVSDAVVWDTGPDGRDEVHMRDAVLI